MIILIFITINHLISLKQTLAICSLAFWTFLSKVQPQDVP